MNITKKWAGAFSAIILLVIAPLILQLATPVAKATSVSTLAKDWGINLTDDKKNIIWSADLIKAEWVDAATIRISSTKDPSLVLLAKPNNEDGGDTQLFDQRGMYYDQKDYALEGWHKNPCWGEVHWNNPREPYKPVSKVTLDMDFSPDTLNDCVGGKGDNNTITIDVENPENSIAYFKWLDPAQIQTIDNNGPHANGKGNGLFKQSEYPNVYVSQDDEQGSCQDRLLVSNDKNSVIYYELGGDYASKDSPSEIRANCKYVEYPNDSSNFWLPSGEKLNILNKEAYDTVAPGEGSVGGDADIAGENGPTCESGTGSFGWLVCPVLGGIDSFIEWAEDKIENQLTVDLGTKETRDSLQGAWRIVARLASGILVAIALVMVISTALGSDLVSPYALKKVLPRLVIGAIGIWLSWALVTTYIDIVNDVGRGIKALMLTPFVDAKEFGLADIAAIAGAGGGGVGPTGAIFVGLATYGVFSVGVFGLLSMAVTALFAFVVAIFVLALRQAVIVFLVIMAPLGFAMWILPNTQKTWKLWSGTLNKLLIMYPMIMGLLTAGKIFAWITSESAKDQGGLDKFLAFSIALIAFVAPYFFLPAVFKAAGGVFSNLTGMVNDKGKGLIDRWKGGLDEKGKARQAFKNQLKSEKQARIAAGKGVRSRFARANMRTKGGQPITGGVLTLRNRSAATQRVQSSMAAAQEKLEKLQIEEETSKMLRDGDLMNNKERLTQQATTGSLVQRRAAINRLMQLSDDENIRKIKVESTSSADRRVRNMWSQVQSSKELVDAFKDGAPDIIRGDGAFSSGLNTAMLTKATKGTYALATSQYKEASRLLSGLSSGAIKPETLSSSQVSLLGSYADKTPDGRVIFNATSLTNGLSKLHNTVRVTAASAKEASTNPALRADFKAAQATEALKMLEALDTTFTGVASSDIAIVQRYIDRNTGLK